MIWSFAAILTFVAALVGVDKLLSAPKYVDGNSDHFDGKKFVNPDDSGTHHYFDVLKWWLSGNDKGVWHKISEDPSGRFPAPEPSVPKDEFRATFVNHATFLLQVEGMNILTDPVWSDRASPYQWIGPKRMRPPGIAFNDLPSIDIVLLTHNHYDHLDITTIHKLNEKYEPKFIVPLGVERFLHDEGIFDTVHLDWWDTHILKEQFSLTAVPARHFSGRGLFDRNKTLWCGYVLHTSVGNIYFAGDTAYGKFLTDIGKRFGPMHTSFIPIGAYKPRWFMEPIHVSPEEAVQVHKDVQSQTSIAMHFGTFPMADDGMYEAVEALQKELDSRNVNRNEFKVLKEGETHLKRQVEPITKTA
ncbi:MAG: MBL fold metallo-hydrolase [Balneolaceae bacterium]|jgi:L-ascorbate metabolism protein UlaG (beta-lactamase superfamily)